MQPININMRAVEPAPIEETGANTSSSGSYQSSTALSQPNHPHFSVQSAGVGSKAATEQHVEADGACTSSSGSSHASTSSAQEGGGSSTSGVSPSRKRSWTTASIESERMEELNQQPACRLQARPRTIWITQRTRWLSPPARCESQSRHRLYQHWRYNQHPQRCPRLYESIRSQDTTSSGRWISLHFACGTSTST